MTLKELLSKACIVSVRLIYVHHDVDLEHRILVEQVYYDSDDVKAFHDWKVVAFTVSARYCVTLDIYILEPA